MIRQYECEQGTNDAERVRFINAICADLAAQVIDNSDIKHLGTIMLDITIKKVRNRSKTATTDRYVITAHLHA